MHQIISRGNNKVLGRYKNGNYFVEIWDNGTKIRIQPDDNTDFIPAFAESCDVKITDKCDGKCPFCYENCTTLGKHGDLKNFGIWNSLHPYTEMAINGNDLSHPELEEFLQLMKSKSIIVNMTVNQKHCEKHFYKLASWSEQKLINGLGISLRNVFHKDFFNQVKKAFPNAVIHTIAGITTQNEYMELFNRGFKILILGYKNRGRGIEYKENKDPIIQENMWWLTNNLKEIISKFEVVSFDNLALEQLKLKESGILSQEEWDEFYMGDDGNYTFYIDLVKGEFARDSMSEKRYPIGNKNIDEMFNFIRDNEKV